jgi:hypothetical protein
MGEAPWGPCSYSSQVETAGVFKHIQHHPRVYNCYRKGIHVHLRVGFFFFFLIEGYNFLFIFIILFYANINRLVEGWDIAYVEHYSLRPKPLLTFSMNLELVFDLACIH